MNAVVVVVVTVVVEVVELLPMVLATVVALLVKVEERDDVAMVVGENVVGWAIDALDLVALLAVMVVCSAVVMRSVVEAFVANIVVGISNVVGSAVVVATDVVGWAVDALELVTPVEAAVVGPCVVTSNVVGRPVVMDVGKNVNANVVK